MEGNVKSFYVFWFVMQEKKITFPYGIISQSKEGKAQPSPSLACLSCFYSWVFSVIKRKFFMPLSSLCCAKEKSVFGNPPFTLPLIFSELDHIPFSFLLSLP